ncbi:MAG TPA: hypothetical protein VMS22_06325 [Candidatus Eisenbacteria bacterium]|nr:hypothetical protein [Candidatus Eisenbacteria bacterium]
MTPAEANRPRWRGGAGFFEIWFLVVFDPAAPRAWWFRWTTFAPRVGAPRGTIWAAAFEEGREAIFGKAFVPRAEIEVAVAALGDGSCRGEVALDATPIAWDLRFEPATRVAARGPAWLGRLPAPTHVAHVHQEVVFAGTVRVGDREHVVARARGAQKHIWGTRRVEELFWIYAPALDGGGAFEASSVRVKRGSGPALAPVWLHDGASEHAWWGVPAVFRNRVEPEGPGALRLSAASTWAHVHGVARCDPRTLAGYVYRDPAGWDVHVAQSDVARIDLTLRTRSYPWSSWGAPRRFTGRGAVELHHPEPLPGVRYVAWDDTVAKEVRA